MVLPTYENVTSPTLSAHLTLIPPTYENVISPIPLEKSGNVFHLKENPEKKIQVNPYSSSRINQV